MDNAVLIMSSSFSPVRHTQPDSPNLSHIHPLLAEFISLLSNPSPCLARSISTYQEPSVISNFYLPLSIHVANHLPLTDISLPHTQIHLPLSQLNLPLSYIHIPLSQMHLPLSQINLSLSQICIPISQNHLLFARFISYLARSVFHQLQ